MTSLKETARLYFMVKGHIPEFLSNSPEGELQGIYNQYLERLWGNVEAYYRTEGFDEAWEKFNEAHTAEIRR